MIYHVKVLKEAALGHYTHMITVGVLLTDFNVFSANRNTNVFPVRPVAYNLPSGRNHGRSGNTVFHSAPRNKHHAHVFIPEVGYF